MKALAIISIFLYLTTLLSAQGPATWNQSTAYTHPALVINGTTTYLSLQNVPADTDITNTTYWSTLDNQVPNETPSGSDSLTTPDASEVSDLAVPDSSQNAKIVSVNVRGTIGKESDGEMRIMGFILSSSSGVLMRGIGPQLEDFTNGALSASVLLPDPSIKLYKYKDPQNTTAGSDRITDGDNEDYTSNTNISEIDAVRAALNPAFPFNPKQAVSMPTLSEGFYTLRVQDVSGATGIGTAAVDLPSSSTASFSHVSTRGLVQTTEYMFGGFQIIGTGKRKIFMRGRGPSLSKYNVPNVMTDTVLELKKYEDGPGTPSIDIDISDDYTSEANSAEILSLSTSLYGWPAIESKESALLLELDPGYYTIQLQSLSTSTDGNGWIGLDDVTDQ
jgi:hypothetical protein